MHKKRLPDIAKGWRGALLTFPEQFDKLNMPSENGGSRRREARQNDTMGVIKTKRRRAKYREELPRQMYTYFTGYSEASGAPSFSKFARGAGLTLSELASFRKRREFDAAWRECNEIRRDYLIDQALSRRFDGSFTKFIYALEYGEKEDEGTGAEEFKVVLEVVGDKKNGA